MEPGTTFHPHPCRLSELPVPLLVSLPTFQGTHPLACLLHPLADMPIPVHNFPVPVSACLFLPSPYTGACIHVHILKIVLSWSLACHPCPHLSLPTFLIHIILHLLFPSLPVQVPLSCQPHPWPSLTCGPCPSTQHTCPSPCVSESHALNPEEH